MKDTAISYDIVHHHQQQQPQQQQPQQQQQHHTWNQQRIHQQQPQTHTTSVYASQSNHHHQQQSTSSSQARSTLNHQPNQHAASQLGQYHHQQMQSNAHHQPANPVAAYYHHTHPYNTYQTLAHSQNQHQQSQHAAADQQHGHQHHTDSSVPVTGANPSIVNAAVVAAAQQHTAVHHQQDPSNTQASALNHTGWSQGVGTMTPQAHHAVVTDHSTLAYMTHAYQSHNQSSVADHHRDSNGAMSSQPIGSGPQSSTYSVDSMYNTPAAAAAAVAAAAYGYNNYNAAFFQTSNNGPHSQTGHPSAMNISTFWSHSQAGQQRTPHSQAVSSQSSVQQRQPIASEETASYIHDPRMYYSRPTYGQGIQNFGQGQPQADVIHHRMTAVSQQHQLLQHHDQQMHSVTHHPQAPQSQQQQHLIHQQTIGGLSQPLSGQNQQTLLGVQLQTHQNLPTNPSVSGQIISPQVPHAPSGRQIGPVKGTATQHSDSKQTNDLENSTKIGNQLKTKLGYEENGSSQAKPLNLILQSSHITNQSLSPHAAKDELEINRMDAPNSQTAAPISKDTVQQSTESKSSVNKPSSVQPVVKSDPPSQYKRKPQSTNAGPMQNKPSYRSPQGEARDKIPSLDSSIASERDPQARPNHAKSKTISQNEPDSIEQEQNPSIEESMSSLSIGATRKTTWASIASQPAKVSQPKSLKSKIAGSNSVLSSAKHLAAVSLDTTSLDSKTSINPAIKSSVSSATTLIQRSSIPPPVSKVPSVAASLKLDLLGPEGESSRISWPAVNASIDLADEPTPKDSMNSSATNPDSNSSDKHKNDDLQRNKNYRDQVYKDHNHNQGANSKMVNSYYGSNRGEYWNRREPRDYNVRRDSERRDGDFDKQFEQQQQDDRGPMNSRRDNFKAPVGNRMNQVRGDETSHRNLDRDRDFRRGPMNDRGDSRGNDGYQRFSKNRFDSRDSHHQSSNNSPFGNRSQANNQPQTQHHHYNNIRDGGSMNANPPSKLDTLPHPNLDSSNFNPKTFELEPSEARYFIIKSYSEDDIHRSIKYSIWCSTQHGNKRLDAAFREQKPKDGKIYLFFSVNGSGHFCGMAQMMSSVDFDSSSGVWAQSKWQGEFSVKWIYVKDVPNNALRHITLENNENKPVTNSRDTQEVPSEKGRAVLKILHQYPHTTSLFDDFLHYERRQEEEKLKKGVAAASMDSGMSRPDRSQDRTVERPDNPMVTPAAGGRPERGSGSNQRFGRPYMNSRPHNNFPGNRDRSSRFAA